MPTHQSFVFLHVVFKVSLMCVVDQETAFVEGEIPLAEAVPALVPFTHVADDNGVEGGGTAECLHCSLLFGTAGDNAG